MALAELLDEAYPTWPFQPTGSRQLLADVRRGAPCRSLGIKSSRPANSALSPLRLLLLQPGAKRVFSSLWGGHQAGSLGLRLRTAYFVFFPDRKRGAPSQVSESQAAPHGAPPLALLPQPTTPRCLSQVTHSTERLTPQASAARAPRARALAPAQVLDEAYPTWPIQPTGSCQLQADVRNPPRTNRPRRQPAGQGQVHA